MRDARTPKAPPAGLAAAKKAARHAPQEVRILGGQWKRSPLSVPVAAGLRPTPSRVRETLFNWLGQDLSGWVVLDAFAGSGALGLESASRGAQAVTLIEKDASLAASIRQSVARLKAAQASVHQGDALPWMRHAADKGHQFDLVFLDPPFDGDLFDVALQAACQCVPIGGWIYLEAPRVFDAGMPGLVLSKHGKAGAVHFHLFQRVDARAQGSVA